ncbi:hypothetical protein HWV62_25010 [Athelia sp. TMB]|nr:hypothetical protein HWV62_25010 [Athelia sp. TMB]
MLYKFEGRSPQATEAIVNGATWVAYHGSAASNIPPSYPSTGRLPALLYESKFNEDGGIVGHDWAVWPDRFRAECCWRGFLPKRLAASELWLTLLSHVELAQEPGARYRINAQLALDRASHANPLFILIAELHKRLHLSEFGLTCPQSFPVSRLSETFPTRSAALITLAQSRYTYLDAAAWCCWIELIFRPRIDSLYPPVQQCLPDQMQLFSGPKTGFIVDLAHDWLEASIGLYLRSDIPVYYQWSGSLDKDARFSALHPQYIAVKCEMGDDLVRLPIDVEVHRRLCNQAEEYDFFFQKYSTGGLARIGV